MKINTTIFSLVILYLFCVRLESQEYNYHFKHITTNNGLSQSNITCILQDNKGFMWFGTFNGLNKYDGYDFTIFNYTYNDSQSISHNYISSLFQDQNGYLWVGTSDGLNRYDPKSNSFKSYKKKKNNPESIIDNQIQAILEDSQGRLWVGTRNGGLDLFNPQTESFFHHFHDKDNPNSLSSNGIEELFEDSDGNLWIAHLNGSIDILNGINGSNENFSVHREKLTNFPITAIIESSNKNIWIATQGDGLYRVKFENGQMRQLAHYSNMASDQNSLSSNIILCLMVDSNNKIWIGTEDNGINILNIETNNFQSIKHDPLDESSLNHNSVWQIYKDNAENIWVGTYAYGIDLLCGNNSFIQHYSYQAGNKKSLSHNIVNSFFEDKNNNIWIATDGGGLNLFDRKSNEFIHYNSKNSNINTDVIVSLLGDSRGRLWVGTWTNGLYQFNPSTKKFTQYTMEKDGLGSNRILNIVEDRSSGLWLSTFYGGLTYFNTDDRSALVYNTENSALSDNYTRVVLQDFDGNLWIGTDSGVDFFNTKTTNFIHLKHDLDTPGSLSSGFVHSIIQTADSAIWIGTTGGLNKYDRETKSFIHYYTDDGLPNNEIKCIIEDKDGILWLSTSKGISRFNRKTKTFKNYDVSDGLQGNEFNARSGWKTKFGEIVFGGNNGFNIFQPSDLKNNMNVPPVLLTDFKIFNKSVPIRGKENILPGHISEVEKITLSYRHAVFSFDFVALNYVSPNKNQYAYMMEGFESDWNYVGSTHSANYTNLNPGNYIFKVKASNNDGLWNEKGTSIKITIDPPFWRTWWAYLIESLLVLAAIAFVANYFISRQRLKNTLQMEHLELDKMYESDQMKTQFFGNISHEFHSPLTLILSPLEKLIASQNVESEIHNSLKLIHRNAKRLQRMTNQLRDFQKIESGDLQLRLSRGDIILFLKETVHSFHDYAIDHQIRYLCKSELDRFFAWFDADKLDKIIYNLLSNAFKFTPDGGKISVDLSIVSPVNINKSIKEDDLPAKYIKIVIDDSGIGIPDNNIENIFQRYYRGSDEGNLQQYQGSGVGLAFAYELIKLYHGEINVNSTEGKGSTFTVQIPIDENYLEEKQLVTEFKVIPTQDNIDLAMPVTFEKESSNEDATQKDMPVLLVVEDDKEIRDYIKGSLELKYRIFSAANGKEGIKKATKIIPDLIVSDIKMPELSGIDLCKKLKGDEKTSHIPIILLTAYMSREFKIESLEQGADAYLSKPFNIDELDAQIINLLETRRKLKEKYCRQILLEPTNTFIEDIDEKFLQRVLETIEKYISDNKFNADILSKKIGMSRMQLYRKLRGLTGQTVHEFIRSIKLKRAVQLLKEKRMTITEVAYEVGFNDLTYFARCFRQQYKKSPSEFISDIN